MFDTAWKTLDRPLPPALDDDGYQIVPDTFDQVEVEQLLSALSVGITRRSKAGARHLMGHPSVLRLANAERMLAIARRFVGPQPQPFRATLFDKSPASNWLVTWHQDTALPLARRIDAAGWGPWSIKAGMNYAHAPTEALNRIVALRVHLDDSTTLNGPLRIVPGSQRRGVLSDEEVHQIAFASETIECHVPRGGVLAMRPLVIHASSKSLNDRPRRVLHIEYADAIRLGDGIELAIA